MACAMFSELPSGRGGDDCSDPGGAKVSEITLAYGGALLKSSRSLSIAVLQVVQ